MKTSTINCNHCDKSFSREDREIRKSKSKLFFCSRSCSAKYTNNSRDPKTYKQPEGKCKICQTSIISARMYCKLCYPIFLNSQKKPKNKCETCQVECKGNKCQNCYYKSRKQKLKYCIDCNNICSGKRCGNCYNISRIKTNGQQTLRECIYESCHKSSAFAKVRTRARTIAKQLNWCSCKICGYNKHIEVAHIKSVASFDLDTKISVVNDQSNLVPLCPNCHWEYDNGLTNLPD